MQFVKIGVINYLHQEVKITEHPERYPIEEDFDWTKLRDAIRRERPDIVLSNYAEQNDGEEYIVDSTPMVPAVGFFSGIQMAERWAKLLQHHRKGSWMDDRALFEKYYA